MSTYLHNDLKDNNRKFERPIIHGDKINNTIIIYYIV